MADFSTEYFNEKFSAPSEPAVAEASTEQNPPAEAEVTENAEPNEINETPITPSNESVSVEVPESKPPVNEKISELNSFLNRNPDLSEEDYFNLKKPLAEIPEEDRIKKYLAEKEGLTPTEIKLRLMELQAPLAEDDFGDEPDTESIEFLKAQAEKEKLLKDADSFYTEQVQKLLNSPEGNTGENAGTPELNEEDVKKFQQEVKQNYDAKVMQASNELQGIDIEINGQKLMITPTDNERQALRETGYKLAEITGQYFSEDGIQLERHDEFTKDILYWITPETRTAALKSAYEQGLEEGKASQMKSQRNINNSARIEVEGDSGMESAKNQLYQINKMAR